MRSFLLIVRTRRIVTAHVVKTLANGCDAHEYRWILGFSSIQPSLCRSLLPTRGRNFTYDFTPIADPTFDGSLPKGLGHRLRVLPTFVV